MSGCGGVVTATIARIVQKFNLYGRQKIKEPTKLVNSQLIIQNHQKRPSNSAKKAAIICSLTEIEEEVPAARQEKQAHEKESQAD